MSPLIRHPVSEKPQTPDDCHMPIIGPFPVDGSQFRAADCAAFCKMVLQRRYFFSLSAEPQPDGRKAVIGNIHTEGWIQSDHRRFHLGWLPEAAATTLRSVRALNPVPVLMEIEAYEGGYYRPVITIQRQMTSDEVHDREVRAFNARHSLNAGGSKNDSIYSKPSWFRTLLERLLT